MINKPPKVGDFKVNELIKVYCPNCVKPRCVDSLDEVLQILANSVEIEGSESGKDSPCDGRQAYLIRAGGRRLEFNRKIFEHGQHGQSRNHRLGWNVSGPGYIVKVELDKMTGGQKKHW